MQSSGTTRAPERPDLLEARVRTRAPGRKGASPSGYIAPGGRVGVPNGQSRIILRPRHTSPTWKLPVSLTRRTRSAGTGAPAVGDARRPAGAAGLRAPRAMGEHGSAHLSGGASSPSKISPPAAREGRGEADGRQAVTRRRAALGAHSPRAPRPLRARPRAPARGSSATPSRARARRGSRAKWQR